jgi:hypothetical protein
MRIEASVTVERDEAITFEAQKLMAQNELRKLLEETYTNQKARK